MKVHRAFALHADVPAGRARAWNVATAAFAVAAVYGASRTGYLAAFLGVLGGLIAATAVAVVEIERRNQRQSDERVAAFRAVRRLEPVAPADASEPGEVAA